MPKILITGASGFIGSACARAAASQHEVVALVRMKSLDGRIPQNVEQIEFEYGENVNLAELLVQISPDFVIHCAGFGMDTVNQKDESKIHLINVEYTYSLLKACRQAKVKRFVQLGSCFEYGRQAAPLQENGPVHPTNFYAFSKLYSTQMAVELGQKLEISTCALRVFGVWGIYESPNRLVPALLSAQRQNRVIEMTDGKQVRDYLFVDDLATAVVQLTSHDKFPSGQILNFGSGEEVSLRDFIMRFGEALGCSHLFKFGAKPHRPDEMMYLVADMTKAKQLGIPTPRHSQFDQNLKKMKEWEQGRA